jgi:2-methylcitrate dehydratase PrpD
LEKHVVDPKGDSDNPMSDSDLERKFTSNCEPVVGKARCAVLLEHAWEFEKLADVRKIMQ